MKNRPKITKVYIDATEWINFFQEGSQIDKEHWEGVNELFSRVNSGDYVVVASTLIVSETGKNREKLIKLRKNNAEKVTFYSLNTIVADASASLVEKYNFGGADAAHVATARLNQCTIFFTSDDKVLRLARDKFRDLSVCHPRELKPLQPVLS